MMVRFFFHIVLLSSYLPYAHCIAENDAIFSADELLNLAASGSFESINKKTISLLSVADQIQDENGNTALHYAAQYGHLESLLTLLDVGFSPLEQNKVSQSAFDIVLAHSDSKQLIEGILSHAWSKSITAYINTINTFLVNKKLPEIVQKSVLNTAISLNNIEIFFIGYTFCTSFHAVATISFSFSLIKIGVEQGVHVDTVNDDGETALMFVCKSGSIKAADHLIKDLAANVKLTFYVKRR